MKTSDTLPLPKGVRFFAFDRRQELTEALALAISEHLNEGLAQREEASLAVSGGSTPIPLFEQLAKMPLHWEEVDITLVDERWLPAEHADSNERLVRTHLLQHKALCARFTPLKTAHATAAEAVATCAERLHHSVSAPLDVAVLGMGNDGHTASLFPGCAQLAEALATDNPTDYVAMQPQHAPYERISLTFRALNQARHLYLHIVGEDKLTTLQRALQPGSELEMPIRAFLRAGRPLEIYWSP